MNLLNFDVLVDDRSSSDVRISVFFFCLVVLVGRICSAMANRMKEDEKNEKIIRGLLKLPANRRCINCNSLVRDP